MVAAARERMERGPILDVPHLERPVMGGGQEARAFKDDGRNGGSVARKDSQASTIPGVEAHRCAVLRRGEDHIRRQVLHLQIGPAPLLSDWHLVDVQRAGVGADLEFSLEGFHERE